MDKRSTTEDRANVAEGTGWASIPGPKRSPRVASVQVVRDSRNGETKVRTPFSNNNAELLSTVSGTALQWDTWTGYWVGEMTDEQFDRLVDWAEHRYIGMATHFENAPQNDSAVIPLVPVFAGSKN